MVCSVVVTPARWMSFFFFSQPIFINLDHRPQVWYTNYTIQMLCCHEVEWWISWWFQPVVWNKWLMEDIFPPKEAWKHISNIYTPKNTFPRVNFQILCYSSGLQTYIDYIDIYIYIYKYIYIHMEYVCSCFIYQKKMMTLIWDICIFLNIYIMDELDYDPPTNVEVPDKNCKNIA